MPSYPLAGGAEAVQSRGLNAHPLTPIATLIETNQLRRDVMMWHLSPND